MATPTKAVSDLGGFVVRNRQNPGTVTFLPEPERRPRLYTIISADDHMVEPPHMFEGRMPDKFRDLAPRVVDKDDGTQTWVYDNREYPNLGFNAVAGRPVAELGFDPQRFDQMRKGAWDVHERIRDMDINGVYGSVNFPSALAGFAGQRLQLGHDPELGLATVRAWNDWCIDEWTAAAPDRFIPVQLPWLLDPQLAADEIRRNAERGFKAVAFTEAPEKLRQPSLHTGYWDPFLQACEETDTVVCLHVGSSATTPTTAEDAPPDTVAALFFAYAMFAAVDWLYSKIPLRYPNIKICFAEGGVAWVPGLMDRLDHMLRYHHIYGTWDGIDITPAELMKRNFWYCALDDASNLELRHRIGLDHIMLESDYPHLDSSWPDTQEVFRAQVGTFPEDEISKLTWKNAATLFRHPVPESVQQNPDSY